MYAALPKDEIRIEKLEVYAYHGVYAKETKEGQPFEINAVLYTDTHPAGTADNLELSTNYGEVCEFIDSWMKENTCKLIETVAEKLARALLLKYHLISEMELEIRKPEAPIELPFGCVSVKVRRGWHKVYLSVGSNMGNKEEFIRNAVQNLENREDIRVKKLSELIITEPYGGVEQDEFLNGAIEIETLLMPEDLLQVLHEIEAMAGRERLIHWGPRTLDLDILFYDDIVYQSEQLQIPHIDMKNRTFVLEPLCMIAPFFRHPIYQKTVQEMLDELRK